MAAVPNPTQYDIGEIAVVRTEIKVGTAQTLTDPGTLKAEIRIPGATSLITYVYNTDPELVREAEGKYRVDVPVTISGDYYVLFTGTDPAAGANEHTFIGRFSHVLEK